MSHTPEREKFSNQYKGVAMPLFKAYNEAMYYWLRDITLGSPEADSQAVRVVYGSPERIYAKIVSPPSEGQIDLPIIVFYMTGVTFTQSRQFVPPYVQFQKRKVGDKWRLSSKGTPWDFSYNITFMSNKVEHADIASYSMLTRFVPNSYVKVAGIGVELTMETSSDTSDIEPGEVKNRVIRKDFIVKAKGWLPFPYKEVGSITSVVNEYNSDVLDAEYGGADANRESVAIGGVGTTIDLVEPWKEDYKQLVDADAEYQPVSNQEAAKIISTE